MALGELPGLGGIQLCEELLCSVCAGAKRGRDTVLWPKLLPGSSGCASGCGGPVAFPRWGLSPATPGL